MSKKLNIIEAMKMPIGTEFRIVIYGKDDGVVFLRKFDNEDKGNCLYWKADEDISVCESQVYITDESIFATFIPIQQPVSFMEVVKTNRKVKAECDGYSDIYEYKWLHEVLQMIIENNPGREDKSLNNFVTKGKWYIEESEELEDERLS